MKLLNVMNALVLSAILMAFVSLSLPVTCAQPADAVDAPSRRIVEVPMLGITVPCKVISVHDGDTLKVEMKLVADIRLLDCWAPEITGDEKPKGLKSRENLKKLAEGKPGVVHIPLQENIGKSTTLGRVLGRVIINGDDLSYEQVKAGHATKTKAKSNEE